MKPILSGLFVLALVLQPSSSLAVDGIDGFVGRSACAVAGLAGCADDRALSEKKAEVCAAAAFRSHARCLDDLEPTLAQLRKIENILERFEKIGDQIEGCTKISEQDRSRCLQN